MVGALFVRELHISIMTTTIRIPTEQYAFVEIELENVQPERLREIYDEYVRALKGGEGLDAQEWRDLLDYYLQNNQMNPEMQDKFERANLQQKMIINEIKKAIKRITKHD